MKLLLIVAVTMVTAAVTQGDEASPAVESGVSASLPPEEVHIRAGIVILGKLCNTLARVSDEASAQAAVPIIVSLSRDLRSWAQLLPSLPLREQEVISVYEHRYLPIIEKLNAYLRAQGERLAASNYYDTQDLATALLTLYTTAQQ